MKLNNVKVVFTNYFNHNSSIFDGGFYPELAALSNFYAKQHGYKTHFFGDSKSIEIVKNIEYDHITELPQEKLNNIPGCLWSLSKFITIGMLNEPFLHLDIDFIMKQPINKRFIDSEIICFHTEKYVLDKTILLQKAFPIHPIEKINLLPLSYNCAVLGGQNFEYIKEKVNFLLNYVIVNKNFFNSLNCLYHNSLNFKEIYNFFYFPPVLIEQVWLFQLFKEDNKEITKILGDPNSWLEMRKRNVKYQLLHLMGVEKIINKRKIINFVNKLNIIY